MKIKNYSKIIIISAIILSGFVTVIGTNIDAPIILTAIISIVFSALIAAPAIIQLFKESGIFKGLIIYTTIALVAIIVENLAIITGFPYGHFSYGNMLGWKILHVPATLILTFPPLVIGSGYIANKISERYGIYRKFHKIMIATFVLVALDLVLDPGATLLGFWTWNNPGIYYGVPFINFGGWILTGIITTSIFILGSKFKSSEEKGAYSYYLSLIFWTSIAVATLMIIPAFIGILMIMGYFALFSKR